MKRLNLFLLIMTLLMAAVSADAQYYSNGKPIPPGKRSAYYANQSSRHHNFYNLNNTYFGLRLGFGISTVNSDSKLLNTNKTRTGLNVGVVVGTQLSSQAPVFFETGLYYTEKGGKSTYNSTDFSYSLNYLELPLIVKYKIPIADKIAVEPFLGGYLACGVGGKIKDFNNREAYNSFNSKNANAAFNRFDGGIRLGCGFSYDVMYVEAGYDIGLSNIGKDDFDNTRNGCFNLTLGVNF